MKSFRYALLAGLAAIFLAGCGALNALIPEVELPEGAFGLDSGGSELSTSFSDSSSLVSLATGTFSLSNQKFEDLSDDRVTGIQNLSTDLVLKAYNNDIVMYLTRPNNGYPSSITINSITVDFTVSDANNSVSTPPNGDPLTVSPNLVLNKVASCADDAAECGFAVSSVDALAAAALSIAFSGTPAQNLYTVIGSGGENTFSGSLSIEVSNDASELAGATARVKLGESNTKVKVAAF